MKITFIYNNTAITGDLVFHNKKNHTIVVTHNNIDYYIPGDPEIGEGSPYTIIKIDRHGN